MLPGSYAQAKPVSASATVLTGLNVEALVPALPTPVSYDQGVLIPLRAVQATEKVVADNLVAIAQAKAAQEALVAANVVSEQSVVTPTTVTYSGNNYDFGSCAWYVASQISVPSSMGNATDWSVGLIAAGWTQGNAQVGAIGVSHAGLLGHVVIITGVNADGSVNLSEMNYDGWDVVDQRTAPADEFTYFYQ